MIDVLKGFIQGVFALFSQEGASRSEDHCGIFALRVEYFTFLERLMEKVPPKDTNPMNWPSCKHGIHFPPIGSIINHRGRNVIVVAYSMDKHGLLVSDNMRFMSEAALKLDPNPNSSNNPVAMISMYANLGKNAKTNFIKLDKKSCLNIKIVGFDFSHYPTNGQLVLDMY